MNFINKPSSQNYRIVELQTKQVDGSITADEEGELRGRYAHPDNPLAIALVQKEYLAELGLVEMTSEEKDQLRLIRSSNWKSQKLLEGLYTRNFEVPHMAIPEFTPLPIDLEDELEKIKQMMNVPLFWLVKSDRADAGVDIVCTMKKFKWTDEQSTQLRRFLKENLNKLPSFLSFSKNIRGGLRDFLYTPEEQATVDQAQQQQLKIEVQRDKEIDEGVFPWFAYAKYNEHVDQATSIIGFYRMPDGKMKTLYGHPCFKSKRQISSYEHPEIKEVRLIPGNFIEVHNAQRSTTKYWELLPADLRQSLEQNKILITTPVNLYEPIVEKDANSMMQHINEKVDRVTQNQPNYFLLYYSEAEILQNGRVGVVMHEENGTIKPVIITVKNQEYILEVKGCGQKNGVFGPVEIRTEVPGITGGVGADQARAEFEALVHEDILHTDGVKIAGILEFDNDGYQQGYIIRLSPSTVRVSYTGETCYPPIDQPQYVEKILTIYADQFVEFLTAKRPKIIDRSSHTENLLVWGENQCCFTDFSDHLFLDSNEMPYILYQNHNVYTFRVALKIYITFLSEIPGYKQKEHFPQFCKALQQSLKSKGIEFTIDADETFTTIIEKIWEKLMAYQVFNSRQKTKYVSTFLNVDKLCHVAFGFLDKGETLLESFDDFNQEYKYQERNLISKLQILANNDNSLQSHAKKMLDQIEQKGILHFLLNNDYFFIQDLTAYSSSHIRLSDEKERYKDIANSLSKTFIYLRKLKNFIISFLAFFDDELDIVISAQKNYLNQDIEKLQLAEAEVKAKKQQFIENLQDNPAYAFQSFCNNSSFRDLFAMSYYKTKPRD